MERLSLTEAVEDGTGRAIQADDIFAIALLGDVTINPDGTRVCYVETRLNRNEDRYDSDLWIAGTGDDGSTPTRLTYAHRTVAVPRWSPDGAWIAFLAAAPATDTKGLWVIPAVEPGGESRCLTTGDGTVTDFAWAPDGTRLALIRSERIERQYQSDALTPAVRADGSSGRFATDVVTITRIYHKADGAGFLNDRRGHLWVVGLDGQETRLTGGDCDDSAPAWSPDGTRLVFVSGRDLDADYTRNAALWTVSDTGEELARLTAGDRPVSAPAWSPDGASIAYLAPARPDLSGASTYVWLVPAAGGTPRRLGEAPDFDAASTVASDTRAGLSASRPVWAPTGAALYVIGSTRGDTPLWRVPVATGATERLTGPGVQVQSFAVASGGQTVGVNAAGPLEPGDLYSGPPDEPLRQRLTRINEAFLARVRLCAPQSVQVTARDGWEVSGWLIEPVDRQPGERYPLLLEIHGGPHAAYGNAFMFEFQLHAAQGWGVLYLNPRGSTGYGEAFTIASNEDWGGADYADLMSGVDAVLERHSWIDPERLGVTGGSYGGYMTNWIVSHTNRFRVAVTERSVTNFVSKWGASDIGFFGNARQWGGAPWDNYSYYVERSPITHVRDIDTPLLIIHSERDLRCPIEQAEQLFTALLFLQKEVEFVRFPDEGHELSRSGKPLHRLERLLRIVTWFQRYLPPNPT